MAFDVSIILQYSGSLLQGFLYTLGICILGIGFGMLIGGVIAMGKLSKVGLLASLMTVYIEVFRGTPFLIQIFLLYYVGPTAGIELSAVQAGILGLSLYGAAYFAEIFRSGYLAVPKGQIEAARALGMENVQIFFRIVLPQMWGLILAPITGVAITLIKDSAILSVITVQELTFSAQRVIGETFRYVEMYAVIALMYWLFNSILAFLSERAETSCTRCISGRQDKKQVVKKGLQEEKVQAPA